MEKLPIPCKNHGILTLWSDFDHSNRSLQIFIPFYTHESRIQREYLRNKLGENKTNYRRSMFAECLQSFIVLKKVSSIQFEMVNS